MSCRSARASARAFAAVAVAAAATAVLPVATASAATPASGSAVVKESSTFAQQACAAGIFAFPSAPATGGYSSTAGLSATFPVTGGSGSIPAFYGSVQLGGSLTVGNWQTGDLVTFDNLQFSIDNWQVTGVPQGSTTAVALFDPAGSNVITKTGTTQNLAAADLQVDAAAAQYLDAQLHSTFLHAGQSVGSFSLSYTPAS